MTAARFASIRSGVLDDDAFEHVRYVLAAIRGLFEEVENLLPFHDRDRVGLFLEQRLDRRLMGAVGLVLEAVDLDGAFGHAAAPLERLQRADELSRRGDGDSRALERAGAHG